MNILKNIKIEVVIFLILTAVLYGSTYGLFRSFDASDMSNMGGVKDAVSYMEMSQGNYSVWSAHKYRFVVPLLVSGLDNLINNFVQADVSVTVLSFYIINFIFTLIAAYLLWLFYRTYNFSIWLSLVGSLLFITSRTSIQFTSTPLVDSFFMLCFITLLYLYRVNKFNYIYLLIPIFVISKEISVFYIGLLFIDKDYRNYKYIFSVACSLVTIIFIRKYIDIQAVNIVGGVGPNIMDSVYEMLYLLPVLIEASISKIFTPRGINDLVHGYSFLIVLSFMGYLLNYKKKHYQINCFFKHIIPVSLFLAILSSNLGRMFFISSPIMILYTLIYLNSFENTHDL
jgi:hypothetical protein